MSYYICILLHVLLCVYSAVCTTLHVSFKVSIFQDLNSKLLLIILKIYKVDEYVRFLDCTLFSYRTLLWFFSALLSRFIIIYLFLNLFFMFFFVTMLSPPRGKYSKKKSNNKQSIIYQSIQYYFIVYLHHMHDCCY